MFLVQVVMLVTMYGATLNQVGYQLVSVETSADTIHLMVVLMMIQLKHTLIQVELAHFVVILAHTAVNILFIYQTIKSIADMMFVTIATLTTEMLQQKTIHITVVTPARLSAMQIKIVDTPTGFVDMFVSTSRLRLLGETQHIQQ
jgi:hypothetical protein